MITIAICYDFDNTLILGNMQENSFIPEVGMKKEAFWEASDEYGEKHDMDYVLSYMKQMIDAAREAQVPFTRDSLLAHGAELDQLLFPGVEGWHAALTEHVKKFKTPVDIKHYIISSGLDDMIRGCRIAGHFDHIFASGFVYDENQVPIYPARVINYTTKTQYLFRINKGVLNSWENERVNQKIPMEERDQPFSQMIYIGDGATDVPAMKMINNQGGYSIAVYPPLGDSPGKSQIAARDAAEQLKRENRAQFCAEADYRTDRELYRIVTALVRRIVDEVDNKMNLHMEITR